ncbi:IPTL-CTERM sorting domain-containing protein [Diaphorobacter sp. HDW4B]|uniref:IPTL-CTERM sorting domain-containing protein n=1 Tax=Diaphorobacter sp. HDW4B TaxID=2714925 RepID=UPI00140B9FF7|nr:IPTL-CTERM sorting domain-containing protein [Diaphorobacter sp. HDW4B]QIL71763.1 IPTL-CTERM sorting domain-containing protein [Diaphorobacter sp. HDW4B]
MFNLKRSALSTAVRCAVTVAGVSGAGFAVAGLVDASYPTGTTAGTWTVDRYAPAVFAAGGTVAGRSGVLNLGVAQADSLANRPAAYNTAFYNTQGRGMAMSAGGYSVIYGSLFIPTSWTTSSGIAANRRTDMWGTAAPATGGDTCTAAGCDHFPILGFSNADVASPTTAGGTGRYRVWDTQTGWQELSAIPVKYDQWSDMCIAFTGTELKSYINGALAYTQSDLTHADVATLGPTTQFSRMMMQAYNFGSDYTAQWSSIGYGQLAAVAAQTGNGQNTNVSTGFATSLTVVAQDTSGAPLPCVPITFTVPASGASATLSTMTVFTDVTGTATVTATANATAGAYAVTAAAPGLAAPASFNLTNVTPVVVPPKEPTISAAAPIPTLGQWALMALSLLAGLSGMFMLTRRSSERHRS